MIRGPASRGEKFNVSLDRVAIKEEGMLGVLLCGQDFVWSPPFTQRSFLSESSLTMLSESVAIPDSITSSPVYAPWSIVEKACASRIKIDLLACWDRVVSRRRTAKDTSERLYYGGTPRRKTASRSRVRISDVVEEGRVEYLPVASRALGPPGPRKFSYSPSKGKRKICRSPMKLLQNFEIFSPLASP